MAKMVGELSSFLTTKFTKHTKVFLFFLRVLRGSIFLILLAACTPIQPAVDLATVPAARSGLWVDSDQSLGPISPYVFGSNYGPWVSLRPETVPMAETAGITLLRYPGGEWGDKNTLKPFQIDQFVDLARRMGAEPFICVRLPGGTPEQAAELVRYANLEKGYGIKFWAIGNEPSLYAGAEPGAGWVKEAVWDTEHYNREWRVFAEAMRAVDPSIQLIGPEVHQWSNNAGIAPRDPSGRDWMSEFLRHNGDLVDIVAFHRYPFPNNAEATAANIADLQGNGREWEQIIPAMRALIQETTGRDLPIGVTEINSHWTRSTGQEATPDSFYNAIWWGDVLGRLINQQVSMVGQFLLVSGPDSGFGLLGRSEPRPTYYVYQLYKQFGTELLASGSHETALSITAARRADGAITVMIVNLADSEKSTVLHGIATSPEQVFLFDQTHPAAEVNVYEVAQLVDDSLQLTLPAQSITLLTHVTQPD